MTLFESRPARMKSDGKLRRPVQVMNNSKPPLGTPEWYDWVEREANKEFSRMMAPILEKHRKENSQPSPPKPEASEPKVA